MNKSHNFLPLLLTMGTVFIKKPEYESIVPLFFLHRYYHRQRPFLSLAVFFIMPQCLCCSLPPQCCQSAAYT
ncbi:hypothetical protein ACYBMY_005146, partial [Escherichia coli]